MGEPRPVPAATGDTSPRPDPSAPEFERDVRRMFSHIAERYEWFDHVASLGNDLFWRPRALWDLERFHPEPRVARALDVGCGTGELTRQLAHRFPAATVVGVDFTGAMLRAAARRGWGAESGPSGYGRGTVMHLPFADGTFDLVTNAFLVRNLVDLPAAFAEMRRVLRPGGALLALEITEPVSPSFGRLFHAYFDHVVPWLGAAVDSAGPYRYLPDSLKRLPPRSALVATIRAAGFPRVETHLQSMGIVTAFLAEAGPAPTGRGQTP
jgi:demethylmenaquinone methyltransferase / 2-methoxy-6-polyprenyl-1,4-benzoquinol methylase